MLTSEFNNELGALIRSLEQKVRTEPELSSRGVKGLALPPTDALAHIERAIVSLVALHISLRKSHD